jgi:pilus assembly protein CpaC
VKALLISFLSVIAICYAADNRRTKKDPPSTRSVDPQTPAATSRPADEGSQLLVPFNKSIVLERPAGVRRISISNADIAEATAVSATEILINGKTPGETNLIVWDLKGNRATFDIRVLTDPDTIDSVRDELARELGPGVTLTQEGKTAFLRGTVSDPIAAERAYNIASTLGKVVDLLRVTTPPAAPQILLKVRFATVSRTAAEQFGFNVFAMNQKGIGNASTNQFGNFPTLSSGPQSSSVSFNDLLNIFYFRPDLNIGTFIQALEAKNILQILAEPNLLTVSGEQASFLAGGEFPFPTIQGGASGVGQITVQFKEFGIRLNFLPVVTPRGSIMLKVMPEVSSLDYSNGLTVNGFSVPGLATRRVQTEVELENEQSFVIAGLLDKQVTEQLNKIPGLANIPVLGKLFESKSLQTNDTELLVVVTPELVRPVNAGGNVPALDMPLPWRKGMPDKAPRTPGADVTGTPTPLQRIDTVPIEVLKSSPSQGAGPGNLDNKDTNQMPTLPPQSGSPTPPPSPGTVK